MFRDKKKRRVVIIAVSILAVVGVGLFVAKALLDKQNASTTTPQTTTSQTSSNNLNNVDYSAPTDAQKNAAQDTNPKNPSQSDTTQPTSTIPIEITATVQAKDSSKLQLRALISELLSTGTCTLQLSKSGQQTVVMTSGVQAQSSSSTCMGFDIDTSSLAKGTWTANLSVTANGVTGTTTKEVTVQ